jgi:hypothetical protein
VRPEERVEQKARELVWIYLGIRSSRLKVLGDNGYPDDIFWLPGGKPLLIEFKDEDEEPRPLQDEVINELRELGYEVQVHTTAHGAFGAVIDAVDSPQLPKESRKILARARRCCAVLRSRAGKD